MRYSEFTPNATLLEYDPNISDEQLKDIIVQRLATEKDREMLDRIYQALEKSTLDERIAATLSKDQDAKSKLQVFAGYIMNTQGTYVEKENFLNNFEGGYIDSEKLRTPNQVHSFDEWLMGDAFVKRVFSNIYTYTPQGIGAGEFALAVLSPNIQFAGRSAEFAGDLVIDGVMTEVKAKQSSGGRFQDARKGKFNQRAVEAAFKDAGFDTDKVKSVTAISFVKDIRGTIDPKKLPGLAETIIAGAFAYMEKGEVAQLKNAIISGDANQIRHEWGLLSITNYKRMSNFDAMLLLDGPKAHSLFFNEASDVSGVLVTRAVQLYGSEQTVHPQMEFQI